MSARRDARLDDAAKLGFNLVRVQTGGRPKSVWQIECSSCSEVVEKAWNTSPDNMAKNMGNAGWSVGPDPLCPRCRRADKVSSTVTQIKPPSAATEPNPKIARRVIVLLEEHFDEEARLYADGWDDDRVARETQASLEFVRRVRREAYGELAEDPRVASLRSDLVTLRQMLEDAERRLVELERRGKVAR